MQIPLLDMRETKRIALDPVILACMYSFTVVSSTASIIMACSLVGNDLFAVAETLYRLHS